MGELRNPSRKCTAAPRSKPEAPADEELGLPADAAPALIHA
jgi:hypothetical protein